MAGFSRQSRTLALLGRSWSLSLHPELSNTSRQQYLPTQQRQLAAKATAEADTKIKKPSRAPSAYNLFQKDPEVRERLTAEAGSADFALLAKKLSEAWKAMSVSEKNKYVTEADAAKSAVLESKPAKEKKKLTAYNVFTKEHLPIAREKHPEMQQSEVFKLVAKSWGVLSDSEKAAYKEKAESS